MAQYDPQQPPPWAPRQGQTPPPQQYDPQGSQTPPPPPPPPPAPPVQNFPPPPPPAPAFPPPPAQAFPPAPPQAQPRPAFPPPPAPPAPTAPAQVSTPRPAAAIEDDPFDDDPSDATIVVVRADTATEWKLIDTDGTAFPLHSSNVLGRRPSTTKAPENAQLVALSDPGKVLSRTHARIEVEDDFLWVIDLDSTNGTEVIDAAGEAKICLPGKPYALGPGASLSLGGRHVSFEAPEN